MVNTIYSGSSGYSVGKPGSSGVDIYKLLRPVSVYERNHWKKTPFTERICWDCRGKLGNHMWLVFLDPQKLSKLWCRKDATSYFRKEKYPY